MKTYKERTRAVLTKVDEYYGKTYDGTVENGGRTLSVKRNKTIALWTLFAAAVTALIIAFNLVLFLPFPVKVADISAYKDSEYYGLISVVNQLTATKPRFKNNFEKWTYALKNYDYGYYPPMIGENFGDVSAAPEAPGASVGNSGSAQKPDSSENGNYQETTNNQVAGVTEGDLLKRSDKYAFYLVPHSGLQLRVYSLNGSDSSLVSEYTVNHPEYGYYYGTCEMYLSEDCNTVTVITEGYGKTTGQRYTVVTSLDVSDVNNIKEKGCVYVSGFYISSRLTDGNLLLFTNFCVNSKPDFSDEAQFLPQAGTPDGLKSISASNVIFDENATSARYTVVCAIDQSSLEITSDYAFLDYSREVYVSENSIYLTHAYSAYGEENEGVSYAQKTNINCISYTQGTLEYVNKATVAGFVLNQYSMDEYDGTLRVVTEVNRTTKKSLKTDTYSGACLYCIDLKSFAICASFEEFSPDGEKVFSVRFDKNTAYVCTAFAYELKDPVFAIELSDLDNITCKDTGTITGYSLSLTKFRDDTLLGVGYGSSRSELKIELYCETENGVESVAALEKSCNFSQEYKAYFIDAEKGLIGLSIHDYETDEYCFILVLFDGFEMNIVESVTLEKWSANDYTRAAYADGYIYVFSEYGFDVINWNA